MKIKTGALRVTIQVECARRGISFSELARRINAKFGTNISKANLANRVDYEVPTRNTLDLLAGGLGMEFEELTTRMKEEVAIARSEGREIGPAQLKDIVNLSEEESA